MPGKLWLISLLLFCGLLGGVAQVLFKTISHRGTDYLSTFLNYRFIIAAGAYFIGMLIYLYVLRFGDVSRFYPIISTAYIWTAVLAACFLKEHISPTATLGIGLIICGVSLMVWDISK